MQSPHKRVVRKAVLRGRLGRGLRPLLVVGAVAVAAAVGSFASHSSASGSHGPSFKNAALAGGPSQNPPQADHQDVSPPLHTLPSLPPTGPRATHAEHQIPGPASSGADPIVQNRMSSI